VSSYITVLAVLFLLKRTSEERDEERDEKVKEKEVVKVTDHRPWI
jgi:hypothetical protein